MQRFIGASPAMRREEDEEDESGLILRRPRESIDLEVEWFDRGALDTLRAQSAESAGRIARASERPRSFTPPAGSGLTAFAWRRAREWGTED